MNATMELDATSGARLANVACPRGGRDERDLRELTDEELLLGYRQTGQRELFAQLVRRYERELYNYLRRYLGDAEVAEDAFQAAFLQVHLKRDCFEEGRKFRPWLYTIALNQAIDALRHNGRRRMISLDRARHEGHDAAGKMADLLVSHEPDPTDELSKHENRERVRQWLTTLPEYLREVVHLVYYQGLKHREAAEALAVPVGTIKSRLHAAVAKLSQAWNNTRLEHV